MMPPALLYLNRLRWRAMGRRMFRGVRTVKGALFFGIGIFMLASWIGPSLFLSLNAEPPEPGPVITLTALFMITMIVLHVGSSAGDKAIYFSPGEVEFLFPGPFSRRQLLIYKLSGLVLSTFFGALLFSVFIGRYTGSLPKAAIGLFAALFFVQLFSMASLLLGQTINERAYTKFRKRVVTVFLIVLAIGLGQLLSMRRGGGSMQNILETAQSSVILQYITFPLQPFGRTIAAATWAECGMWFAIAAGMNGALVLFILLLDAEYRETAVAVSQKVSTQMERARRSGMAQSTKATAARSVPLLPWFGGAGPLLWRQLTNASRNVRSLMFTMILLGTVAVIMVSSRDLSESGNTGLVFVGGALFWITIMLSMMLRYDFRSDLDQMDWLKALPLRAWAIAVGEIAVPVLVATALQGLVLGGMVAIGLNPMLLLLLCFLAPLNLILFGMENFMFLLFPSRVVAFSPGDFQLFGKQMILILAKMMFVFIAGLPAFAVWALVSMLTGNAAASYAGAWATFSALAAGVVPAVAWAFARFDVSADTAG